MTQTQFGNFKENFPHSREFLQIGFSPSSLSIQQRWRNNGLSADFVADYLVTFFPYMSDSKAKQERESELKHAVSYIANELLENAMKFNHPVSSKTIEFGIHLIDCETTQIILYVTNSISPKQVADFQAFIRELLNSDPEELFIQQMEINALDPENSKSRLGFLTMINDYESKLGWKFAPALDEEEVTLVTTMVELTV